jgi:hypothetical protein
MEDENGIKCLDFESDAFSEEQIWNQMLPAGELPLPLQGSQQSDSLEMDWVLRDIGEDNFDILDLGYELYDTSEVELAVEQTPSKEELSMDLNEYLQPYSPEQFDANAQLSPTITMCSTFWASTPPDDLSSDIQGSVVHIPDTSADDNNNAINPLYVTDVSQLMAYVLGSDYVPSESTPAPVSEPTPAPLDEPIPTPMIPAEVTSSCQDDEDSEDYWRGDDASDEFTEEYLFSVSTKDLNHRLQQLGLPEDKRKVIKRKRRTVKNRGYARSCRQKRVGRHEEQDEEVERLRAALQEEKGKSAQLMRELQQWRARCNSLLSLREG